MKDNLMGIYKSDMTTDNEAYKGIHDVADIVRSTLGPYGRTVAIMSKGTIPLVTDDGVRVIEQAVTTQTGLNLLGSRLVHLSSLRTEQEVGDGTTTTYLLADSLIGDFLLVHSGSEPNSINRVRLRRHLENLVKSEIMPRVDELKRTTTSLEDLKVVATVSSGSSEVGDLIGTLRYKMGENGLITIKNSNTIEDSVTYNSGYEIGAGMTTLDFYGSQREIVLDDNPKVLVIRRPITTTQDASALVSAYTRIVSDVGQPLIVYSPGISGDALSIILHNTYHRADRKRYLIIPMDIPVSGGADPYTILQDISVLTGSTLVSPSSNEKLDASLLVASAGHALRATGSRSRMYLVPDPEFDEEIDKHISGLKEVQDTLTTTDTRSEYADIEKRLSRLQGKSCVLELGSSTEVERTERRLKYDDAILATHSAQRDGIVVGGGITYLMLYEHLNRLDDKELLSTDPDYVLAKDLLMSSLLRPIQWVSENSGHPIEELDPILNDIRISYDSLSDYHGGINMYTGEYSIDAYRDAPVFDPAELIKSVIKNAVAATSTFISTESFVLIDSED